MFFECFFFFKRSSHITVLNNILKSLPSQRAHENISGCSSLLITHILCLVKTCHATFCTWHTSTLFLVCPPLRYGEPWGAGPGGAWLQDALSRRVPRIPARADADLLAQGARGAAHFWIPPELPGRLLHLYWTTVPARREPLEKQIQSSVRAAKRISFPRLGKRTRDVCGITQTILIHMGR